MGRKLRGSPGASLLLIDEEAGLILNRLGRPVPLDNHNYRLDTAQDSCVLGVILNQVEEPLGLANSHPDSAGEAAQTNRTGATKRRSSIWR